MSRKRSVSNTTQCYQFKIKLLNSRPPIWRQIVVPEGTLDNLHEHIQTAMGWMNSHLHQFEIQGDIYGNPMFLEDGFEDSKCVDSLKTTLDSLFGGKRPTITFTYEYDFGDGWLHEIKFERVLEPMSGKPAPYCVKGAQCCPPEDIGGVWGYKEFLLAIRDPGHEQHTLYMEWGGEFDPEHFSPVEATQAMQEGVFD